MVEADGLNDAAERWKEPTGITTKDLEVTRWRGELLEKGEGGGELRKTTNSSIKSQGGRGKDKGKKQSVFETNFHWKGKVQNGGPS